MLSSIQTSSPTKYKKRPLSAMTTLSHTQQYRLTDNQFLNNIRTNINQTFQHQNRSLKEVRSLTARSADKYAKRIDRLCQQFNIGLCPKKKRLSANVDVEFIAKRYITSKSKEKKKQQERQALKKEVTKVVNRFTPRQPRSFFKFDVDTLRQMESKGNHKRHPYLQIYEQSQIEAMNSLSEQNELNLDKIGIYADIVEAEDWQRYQKQVKQIYNGVRSLRRDQTKNSPYFSNKRPSSKENFFLT